MDQSQPWWRETGFLPLREKEKEDEEKNRKRKTCPREGFRVREKEQKEELKIIIFLNVTLSEGAAQSVGSESVYFLIN